MMSLTHRALTSIVLLIACPPWAITSEMPAYQEDIDFQVREVNSDVIAWRRDIHEHPEFSNRETRTSALVAEHLLSLGLEVRNAIAHTGVVGVLRGGKPGKVVAADRLTCLIDSGNGLPLRWISFLGR